MYKNNSLFSSKFKGFSTRLLSCNSAGRFLTIGYYSYTNRWQTYEKHLHNYINFNSNSWIFSNERTLKLD